MSIRIVGVFAWLLIAVFGLASTPRADSTSDARKVIQAQYELSNAAISRKDLKGFVSIYSPEYKCLDLKGRTIGIKVVKQRMALVFSQTVSATGSTVIVSINLNNNSALVRLKEKRILAYSSPQTGSVSKVLVERVNDDIWTKNGASWLDSSSKITSEKNTVDGKPVTAP